MLNLEDNAILSQVSQGTPGGEVLRQYWLPFLLSDELPAPDCPPLRIRLLGEDLIAFRTTSNRVGLIANARPHRGASLYIGRTEQDGLRCVYHGWKFDVTGACLDMPSEPSESNFKSKVRASAYACQERNGVVWAYLGHGDAPPLHELEWNLVSQDQCYVSKRVQRCNWFQALEGGIDSSHSNFIHAPLNRDAASEAGRTSFRVATKALHFETVDTEYGVIVANRRPADEGNVYWRMNHYVMPCYTMFPPGGARQDTPISGHAWVPIDDQNTLVFHWSYNPHQPITERQLETMLHGNNGLDGFHLSLESRTQATSAPHGNWYPKQNASNDYLLDYEAQRTIRFSGVPGGWNQDAAVQESMGAVSNRIREHLGTSDMGIIAARRYFLAAAKAYRDNQATPPSVHEPAAFRIRPAEAVMPAGADWLAALSESARGPRLMPTPISSSSAPDRL